MYSFFKETEFKPKLYLLHWPKIVNIYYENSNLSVLKIGEITI